MKPTTIFPIFLTVIGIASLGLIPIIDQEDDPNLTIRVTSEQINESVRFEAVYIFDLEQGELQTSVMKTPVTLQGFSANKTYAAMFRKVEGPGNLHVEIFADEHTQINTGSGTFIVLTPNGIDITSF